MTEQKYKNEQALAEADLKVKELELNIFRKSLAETRRTLEDAQIRSPRKAILTYVNNEIGSQIGQGAKVAIVSDLSHFKIEGEIADTYGDRIAAGSKAVIKIGSEKLDGDGQRCYSFVEERRDLFHGPIGGRQS